MSEHSWLPLCRQCAEGQLKRLGVDYIDLWVLRGFVEKQTSVEETMAAVKMVAARACLMFDLDPPAESPHASPDTRSTAGCRASLALSKSASAAALQTVFHAACHGRTYVRCANGHDGVHTSVVALNMRV